MKISAFLKLERQKRCLTQQEMARKIGVNRSTYACYELGLSRSVGKKEYKSLPSPKTANNIAKFTGCSTEFVNQLIDNERKEKE